VGIPPHISDDLLKTLYGTLVRLRKAEEKIAELYPEQEMRCPVHLYIGQEAVAAGVGVALEPDDVALGSHRSHGPYMGKGGSLPAMFAELYGKKTGCCQGRGGSMHLMDLDAGFLGTSALVSGTIPMATGAALGLKLRGQDRVAACFFGDAAVEEGVFFESLNFASLKKLAVLFVCENNFYATSTPFDKRQPMDNIHQRGEPLGVPGVRVDGNDILSVYEAAREAVDRGRRGEGPTLLECRTYRWRGHVGPNEDSQLGYRTAEELARWKVRCPIVRLRTEISDEDRLSQEVLRSIEEAIEEEVEEAVRFAKESPFPDPAELFTTVHD
jgi:pyruvate dehydrogenase E1 component alpha subunit